MLEIIITNKVQKITKETLKTIDPKITWIDNNKTDKGKDNKIDKEIIKDKDKMMKIKMPKESKLINQNKKNNKQQKTKQIRKTI